MIAAGQFFDKRCRRARAQAVRRVLGGSKQQWSSGTVKQQWSSSVPAPKPPPSSHRSLLLLDICDLSDQPPNIELQWVTLIQRRINLRLGWICSLQDHHHILNQLFNCLFLLFTLSLKNFKYFAHFSNDHPIFRNLLHCKATHVRILNICACSDPPWNFLGLTPLVSDNRSLSCQPPHYILCLHSW